MKLITYINAGRVKRSLTAQTGVTGSVVPLRKVSVSKPATLVTGNAPVHSPLGDDPDAWALGDSNWSVTGLSL